MEKLKPCPFCGGKARFTDLGVEGEFSDWAVECKCCGIVMLAVAEEPGDITTKKECVKSWNNRPGE